MTSLRFPGPRLRVVVLASVLGAVRGFAAEGGVPSQDHERMPAPDERHWLSRIVPLPFQQNPRLVLTVITEFTDAGRQRPLVTPDKPAYYVPHALGVKTRGEAPRETSLEPGEMEATLVRALAKNGFLRSSPVNPPALVIMYMWGSHNAIDPEFTIVPEDTLVRNILDRAALVGGRKFAADLARAYRDTEMLGWSSPRVSAERPEHLQGAPVGIQLGMAQMNGIMSPLRLFAMRTPKHQLLLDQVQGDCHFIVASAYDYASVATNRPMLLWRTRLTVSARGVPQTQSLPQLIASAGPYFGRDMVEPEIMKADAVRRGQVELGTPTPVP